MTSAESITLRAAQLELAAKAWGPPDGTVVLAMHGWLDNANSFDALADRLTHARPDLRLIAWDAAGHGHSQHRHEAYHFVDYVADAMHVIARQGWTECHLLGHSMGAGIATLVAGAMGDAIASAVFFEGLGPVSQDDEDAPRRLARAVLEEHKREQRSSRSYSQLDAAIEKRAEVGHMQRASARALVERATETTGDPEAPRFRWRSDPKLRTSSRQYFAEGTVLAYFRQIACPSVFIRASEGWPVNEARMQARMQAIANLEFVEVPGAHHAHMDTPEVVAEPILDFWSRHLK